VPALVGRARGGGAAPGARFLGNRARAHARLAQLDPQRADEHRRRSVELARQALEAAGDDPAERARHELNLGAALLSAGRPDEALAPLASAVEAWPEELGARLDYGVALALVGRQAEALQQLETAVALAPRSAEAWGKLGEARRAAGERDGAIEAFRRVLALEPGHAAAAARLEALGAAGRDL
jgi:tetratricopeptide (TPR) repeat protein